MNFYSGQPMQFYSGVDNADLVREARDQSRSRTIVASHRLGISARPAILVPTSAAAKARKVEVSLFYGSTSGPFGSADAAELTREASRDGVAIRAVHKPRLHAKILAWDDDAVVITSQNWLSADPPDDKSRQEIGIFACAPRLARNLIERFSAARMD